MVSLSSSLSFLIFLAVSYASDPLHFQLSRRAPTGDRISHYVNGASVARLRYGFSSSTKGGVKRATSASLSMINQQIDASYLGTVNVGTPTQPFNVVLDTGSADLWLAASTCLGCDRSTPLFDLDKSTSLSIQQSSASNPDTIIRYGSGQVSGQLAQDVVSMGGFSIPKQTMLAVDRTSDQLLEGSASGIMGLAFTAIAATGATPFWESLVNGGQLTAPEMAFQLTRFRNVPTATDEEPGGTFTLGGTNSSLFQGDIEFLNMPVNTPSFWLLSMSSVTVQGKSVSITTGASALSAIDTGTTLIGGPTTDVNAIWSAVPGSQPVSNMEGFFSFPCKTQVSISLAFGGKSWPINPADMNLGPVSTGSSQCLGGIFDLSLGSNIVSGGGNPNWVVGATFLKNVYSVYRANPPSVGFAQLSDAVGGSGTPGAATSGSSGSSSGSGGSGAPGSSGNGSTSNKAASATVLVTAIISLLALCVL